MEEAMRRLVIAFGFTLAACVSAPGAVSTAAPFTNATASEAQAGRPTWVRLDLPAGEYRLDPRHASVNFRIRHQGLAWFTGRFDAVAASIIFDPAEPTQSHLSAQIDANSVNTGVTSGFDRQIAAALGAAASPQISFTSTSVTRTGEFTGEMTGDLTMNGQTHPATFAVTYDGGHADPLRGAIALGFSAHATIDRSQWGVTEWSMFVGPNVQLVIEAEFVKV
jgi:polyisoprenoid-binding protein YceI